MTSERPEIPQGPAESHLPEQRQISVRRAPRFVPFLVLGGILGLVAAFIIAFAAPENPEFDRGTVLGFFAVALALPGVLLGALVALVLDRISVRNSRRATVQAVDGQDPDVTQQDG